MILAQKLDITETEDKMIRDSYNAVGTFLAQEGSLLDTYDVAISPQGSFNLGTIIRPIKEGDDLDVDLVCELKVKGLNWTQADVKEKVGTRLKESEIYKKILDTEGRRCWTLLYRDNAPSSTMKYHLDILPCVVDKDYKNIVNRTFSASILEEKDYDKVAIRITDRNDPNYYTETDTNKWLKSNPFGYAKWFELQQCKGKNDIHVYSRAEINPLPNKKKDKTVLQRVIQLLKRHRDILFEGSEDKPISIIITTLAAKAYNGENDIISAFCNVVLGMGEQIDVQNGIIIIKNPVNSNENFADKWKETPAKAKAFYKWLNSLEKFVCNIINSKNKENLANEISAAFGSDITMKTFSDIAEKRTAQRVAGNLRMGNKGIISNTGNIIVQNHNFYGNENYE